MTCFNKGLWKNQLLGNDLLDKTKQADNKAMQGLQSIQLKLGYSFFSLQVENSDESSVSLISLTIYSV